MTEPAPPAKVVLITGAAGGLGQALVAAFLAQGWKVAAGYHKTAAKADLEQVQPLQLDVTNRMQVNECVHQIVTKWQRIDALVNNAGMAADEACWQLAEKDWSRVLDVNLKGAFICSQAVLRPMLKQRDGHIINIASFSARSGQRGQSNYAAAKAGLFGLTSSLAKEVGSRNIRVNTVLPGVLPTSMTARLGDDALRNFAAANALGRLNSLTEVARFMVFLAAMQNVSGQLFQLDSRVGPWS